MMSGAAAAAAAAKRREALRLEEEQETAQMTADDGYEYKIIRSAWASFRHPASLRAALDQEAHAGWDLFEKLDNNRVRLRRPILCRDRDGELSQDPYRTWVGPSENAMGFAVVGGIVIVIVAVMVAVNLLH